MPKNDLSLHCRRKTKQLLKKELSNVTPASSYTGAIEGGSEFFGGTRIMTFMVYFSEVQLGGHTVFPQAGKIGMLFERCKYKLSWTHFVLAHLATASSSPVA